jgi:hypothetical protein
MNSYYHALENGGYFLLNGCLIYGIYLISRICVVSFRSKEAMKASKKEKTKGYLYCILAAAIISFGISFLSDKKDLEIINVPMALKIFEILVVVSVLGVYNGYRDDSKLTSAQRAKNYRLSLKNDSSVDQEY